MAVRSLKRGADASKRRPRGYVGRGHLTIGSDILAVLAILKLPEQILGEEDSTRLRSVTPSEWYPIDWLLDLMEKLDERVGHYGLMRMGRTLFKMSHEERVLRRATCARDVIFGIDAMYHFANRGDQIGGWEVLLFEPGRAELLKTTPHHCVMEQGILLAALSAVGCPGIVTQRTCFRAGADACIYEITSALTGERWSRVRDATS
jgi:hypothetical protein